MLPGPGTEPAVRPGRSATCLMRKRADAWVRRGRAAGYLHPQARLLVIRADPAEVERLRALHQVPRGQHNRRPWLSNQAALMNTDQEGTDDNADKPRL